MAAPAVVTNSGPPLCPSFAEVCSFMERYGPALDLPELTFLQMERYLRDTSAVPKPLVELHVKLLRKLGRSVTTDRWEKYLAKVCQELNSTWAWELEQKGYQEMSMECKSSILKYLCECQFDENLKFKTFVNDEDPEKMRLQPVGRDRQGLMYWLQLDHEQNIRLFTEEQDDLDGSTWKCIVRTRNDLAEAVELLRAQVDPNQSRNQNQAGSRSSSPAAKDTGGGESGLCCSKPAQTTGERSHGEEERLKEDVKRDDATPIKLEDVEVKEKMELRPAAFDNRVSTITAIKQELKDEAQNAVPVVMAPSVILTKVNLVEEAERAVVRSNQQAKIPLKKRDLKLADSFHSNHLSNSSSIIVCNPAVIHSQDGREKAPAGSPASSQQQLLVSAQRQELTNGRASHLPLKEGQNGVVGVKGQAGAVSHVGVIRGPSEYHRATGAEQQEQNGPSSELHRTRVVEEDKELTRKSVLVRKGPPEGGATPAPPFLPPHAGMEDEKLLKQSSRKPHGAPEASERKADSVGITSPSATPQPRRRQEENRDNSATKESEERRDAGGHQQKDEESSSSGSSVKRGGGLNGRVSTKNLEFGSEPKQNPLEEVSSELQKEGIRLKIKIPPHRRNKLRRKGGKAREPEEQEEGRSLRRSVRICRSSALPSCRLSAKVAESQRKQLQKKPALPVRSREAEEDEGDEEEPRRTCGPAGKLRKRRGKRRHGRPRWTVVRSKRRRPDEDLQDSGRTAGEEEEEEGGSRSEEELYKSEEVPREDACTHCGLPNHPELILLCDSCDGGYHTACLRPPLMLIPDGEWFCPPCQHKMLCEKLEEQLQNLDSALKKRERAERRRERLVYVGISVENIIPEGDEEEEEEKTEKQKDCKKSKNLGRRSTRTRKHISYRFDDFDDAIDEAIEEDIRDLCGAGAGRGNDITAVLPEDGKQSQQPVRNQSRSARSRKRRRLNDLESDSTAVESEDEFMLSNSSEDEEFGASGAEDDGEEEGDEEAGSEVGSWDRGTRPKRGPKRGPKNKPKRTRHRGRKWQQRRSSEDEDSDVELDSDRYSDMSDSDAERKRRSLRRGQRQQVNYRETSESSDNSRASSEREKVKRRGRPRKEHLSSDYSDVSPSSRDSEGEEEEDDQKRRVSQRRRADGDESRKRHRDKMDVGDKGRRLRRRQLDKEEDKDQRKRLVRTDRKEEDPDKMGRGKRRELLSQQRRKRLAQMLKKRRPSTDDEEEEEDEEDSSSSDDRPVRKRLNRIDSDDEEEEEPTMMNKKSSVGERWADNTNSDAQERGRGQNLSPSNGHQTCRGQEKPGTGSPAVLRDRTGSGRKERHNRPLDLTEGGQSDSVQNGPRS